MKTAKTILLGLILAIGFSSCTLNSKMMREPNAVMEWKKDDFSYSGQVTGEATVVKIIGIDFARLFKKEVGNTKGGDAAAMSIPLVGPLLDKFLSDKSVAYAMFDLLNKNQGYDVVIYPQVEIRKSGIPVIFTTTKVKVTARLAKLK